MNNSNLKSLKIFFAKKLRRYIKKDDCIYLESDLTNFKNIFNKISNKKEFVEFFFEILQSLLGKNGTLICPSFSYSWGKSSKEKIFDINKTPGKTGIFSEFLRLKKKTIRTPDPMFSFIIFGKKKNFFSNTGNDSFGRKSVFEKMHQTNAKLISFGLNKFDPTFVHYVEQFFDENIKKINYRKKFKFKGIFKKKRNKTKKIHFSFMRPLNSKRIYSEKKIKYQLKKKKLIKSIVIHQGLIQITSCQSFFEEGIKGMTKDINFFNKKIN